MNKKNDRPDRGWKRKRPELFKNATETQRQWNTKPKKSSSERRRNPKRGQRKLDGDEDDEVIMITSAYVIIIS